MSEFINNAANTLANHNGGQGFMGTKMPTLPQWFGRILGGQSAQGWHDTKGMDSIRSFGDQLSGGSRPLMNSGSDSTEHASQLRPNGAQVTYWGGGPTSQYSGQSGSSTSLAGNGRTVGHATMGQVEEMLKGGMGKVGESARSFNELNELRREAKRNGMTLKEYRQAGM